MPKSGTTVNDFLTLPFMLDGHRTTFNDLLVCHVQRDELEVDIAESDQHSNRGN